MAPPPADLVAALRGLVDKLDLVAADPQFQSMAVMNFIHGIVYTGPNWAAELATAKALLAGVPEPPTCAHGHTVRQVGCVSCVLVFDRPADKRTQPQPPRDEP